MLAWDFWELEMRFLILIWALSQFAELSIFCEAIPIMHARYRFCPWFCRLDAGDLIHEIRKGAWRCSISIWSRPKEKIRNKRAFGYFQGYEFLGLKFKASLTNTHGLPYIWVASWKPSASSGANEGETCFFCFISSRIKGFEMTNRTNKLHNVKFIRNLRKQNKQVWCAIMTQAVVRNNWKSGSITYARNKRVMIETALVWKFTLEELKILTSTDFSLKNRKSSTTKKYNFSSSRGG